MLLEVEVQVVAVGQFAEVAKVRLDQRHDSRQVAFVARVDADVAGADGLGDGHHLVDILATRAADFQVQVQAQGAGLVGEGLELGGAHLRQAVLFTVQQVQGESLEFVAVGEIQHVRRHQAAMGEVGQQRVAMGEQADAVEAFEEPAGQGRRQRWRRGFAVGVVAQQGRKAGLDSVHSCHSW
ncbi:hypothetical protein D3C84_513020 [compost metagenome]